MYYRPYSTVSATDPEETISAFGTGSDLRMADLPEFQPMAFDDVTGLLMAVWRKFFRLAD